MKYTPEQINELDGPELRAAVAECVMGLRDVDISYAEPLWWPDGRGKGMTENVPAYERDHNAMMQVVAEMQRRECYFNMQCLEKSENYAAFDDGEVVVSSEGESLPVAVCRAALLCVAAQGEK